MKREVDLPPYVMPVILVLLLVGMGIYWIQSPPAQSTEEAVWIPRACGPIFAKVGGPKMNSYTFTQTVNFLVRTEKTGKSACTPEQARNILGLLQEYARSEGQAREDLKYQVTQALTNDQLVELSMLVDVPDDPGCGPGWVDQVAASAVQTEEPKEDPKAAPATGTEGPKKKGEKPPPADSPAKAEATTSSQGCQEGSSSTPPDLRQDAKPKVEELIKLLQARGQKAAPEKGAKPEV